MALDNTEVSISQEIPGTTNAVEVIQSVLATGAATEATQLLIKAKTDNLDVALSTRNLEATQLLIKAKTDNLDVALSTRLADATFTTRINTLGQKAMTASTPVVIASDQSAIEVKGTAAVGSAPTNPPLAVSGVDIATGFKQHIPLKQVGANFTLLTDNTSWLGSTAPTVGQKTMLNSIPVVISSDQTAIEVKGTAAVGTAPTNPPLSVSGVDVTTGFKQHIPLTPVGGNQAVRTVIAGISRTPSLVSVPANTALSNTTAGVQEVSIIVRAGANAQIGGIVVANGTVITYRANPGDTIGSISYQTGAGSTLLISYII